MPRLEYDTHPASAELIEDKVFTHHESPRFSLTDGRRLVSRYDPRPSQGAGQPVEALHLTNMILAYDQKNVSALNARIKAMEYLRQHTQNRVESGWLDYEMRLAKEKLATSQ